MPRGQGLDVGPHALPALLGQHRDPGGDRAGRGGREPPGLLRRVHLQRQPVGGEGQLVAERLELLAQDRLAPPLQRVPELQEPVFVREPQQPADEAARPR
jgi:hypothetical protein